jgi:hypothetical protein
LTLAPQRGFVEHEARSDVNGSVDVSVCVSEGGLVSKRTGLGASMRACRVFFTPARPQQDTEKSRLVFQFFDDVAFQKFSVVEFFFLFVGVVCVYCRAALAPSA